MKPPLSASSARALRGSALLLVLGSLIFLSILVVAFMVSIKTELRSSKAYADNNTTRMLSDTAVNIVMSQIRAATTETGTAWASQPGMIRTFNSTSGSLSSAYKLYSSSQMVDKGQSALTSDLTSELAGLKKWSTQSALYTDLNEPANGVYPILAPPPTTLRGYG